MFHYNGLDAEELANSIIGVVFSDGEKNVIVSRQKVSWKFYGPDELLVHFHAPYIKEGNERNYYVEQGIKNMKPEKVLYIIDGPKWENREILDWAI